MPDPQFVVLHNYTVPQEAYTGPVALPLEIPMEPGDCKLKFAACFLFPSANVGQLGLLFNAGQQPDAPVLSVSAARGWTLTDAGYSTTGETTLDGILLQPSANGGPDGGNGEVTAEFTVLTAGVLRPMVMLSNPVDGNTDVVTLPAVSLIVEPV